MGQPYQPNIFEDRDQLGSSYEQIGARPCPYGLGTDGIDLPNESITGYVSKEFTIGNYLTDALVSLTTIPPCSWLNMLQPLPMMGNAWHHLVQGIYENDAKECFVL